MATQSTTPIETVRRWTDGRFLIDREPGILGAGLAFLFGITGLIVAFVGPAGFAYVYFMGV